MQTLNKDVKFATEQFPKLGAGQYGTEISALLVASPDVIHSSLWGGDMEAFVLQGTARGAFDKRTLILTAGESAMHRLAGQIPDGTIIGARGPHGDFAPKSALNDWFRKAYEARFNTPPTYPSYKMAQALFGLKAATEKAAGDQAARPTDEAIVKAFEGLTFTAPSGEVHMKLGNGHQAIQEIAYGTFKRENGKATLVDVVRYPAECVNPPEGVKSMDWLTGGLKGAKCD
jgi:branched-chain amino acid transport system substrate-binding protein